MAAGHDSALSGCVAWKRRKFASGKHRWQGSGTAPTERDPVGTSRSPVDQTGAPRSSGPAIISRMMLRLLSLAALATLLVGCRSLFGPPVYAPSSGQPSQQPGTPQPEPGTPSPQQPVPTPPTPQQPPKEFRLGPASTALVKQARTQSVKGEYPAAVATLERALRIEPDNPLVWLELGQVHLASRNPTQAESMGRKAIALATGNPAVQSSGWRLVGDALRARGRDLDATEAYQRAGNASPR